MNTAKEMAGDYLGWERLEIKAQNQNNREAAAQCYERKFLIEQAAKRIGVEFYEAYRRYIWDMIREIDIERRKGH